MRWLLIGWLAVGVLLVVGVTTAVVFALSTRESFRRNIGVRVTRHLSSLVGERIGDPAALADRLRQIHDDVGLDVRVRDLTGRTVASAGEPVPVLTRAEEMALRAGRTIVRAHPIGLAAAPVRDPSSGAVVGFVEGAVPRPLTPPPLWRPFLFVGGVLLVVAVATRPLARRISRPLEQLTVDRAAFRWRRSRRARSGGRGARAPRRRDHRADPRVQRDGPARRAPRRLGESAARECVA